MTIRPVHGPLHESQESKVSPFYWILRFEVMSILMALGLVLMLGPGVLLLYAQNIWSFASLLLIPAGWLLFRFAFRFLRNSIWRNRHLSSYRLYEDRIETTVYPDPDQTAAETRIPLQAADMLVVSALATRPAANSTASQGLAVSATAHHPVVWLRYRDDNGLPHLLQLPLSPRGGLDIWMDTLQHRIPFFVTSVPLLLLPEPQRLEALEDGYRLHPFHYSGDLYGDFRRHMALVQPTETNGQAIQTSAAQPGAAAAEPKPPRPKIRFWARPALSTLVLHGVMLAGLYVFIAMAAAGKLGTESLLPCLGLLIGGAAVYFAMARPLALAHVFRYLVTTLPLWFVFTAALPAAREGAGYAFMDSVLGSLLLLPFLIWLPYGLIKLIRRQRT